MTTIDLDKMDLQELRDLRKKLDKTIENYETRKRQDALAAAENAAKENGFSLSELMGEKKGRAARSANPPKFRHPENPEQTWTGKGRQPGWIKQALDGGASLEDFRI